MAAGFSSCPDSPSRPLNALPFRISWVPGRRVTFPREGCPLAPSLLLRG